MSAEPLMGAFVGHLVGDFLVQTDWQAKRKKSSSLICAVHVTTYTACVLFFSGWCVDYRTATVAAVSTFVPHFAIDRTSFVKFFMTKVTDQRAFYQDLSPWSAISVDQAMHLLCLYILNLAIQAQVF